MRERIWKLLVEIEDINNHIQNGGLDRTILDCFISDDHEDVMEKTDALTLDAFSTLEQLMDMMKEGS